MIDAIKQGDALAFKEAYLLYREKLLAYFLKKVSSAEDAKDLLQVTFAKLWQYRKSLSENYLLEQQLFYIARNVFIDHLRKENKQSKIKVIVKTRFEEKQTDDYVFAFDAESRLNKMLSGMPDLRKTIFHLHRIEGYSYKEIAEMLKIPVKSVDNNLAKALKYLRNAEIFILVFVVSFFV